MSDPQSFRVRPATVADAPLLARHRAAMFLDMDRCTSEVGEALRAAAEPMIREWVAAGTYLGFLAEPAGRPGEVAGGAGLQLRPLLPRPGDDGTALVHGPEGYVLNVYVERAWRRRGVARLLMEHVLAETRRRGLTRVTLHSSEEGKPLYERLGFGPTNELRLR
jgi:GNAT superfamily N-acetyltransferase